MMVRCFIYGFEYEQRPVDFQLPKILPAFSPSRGRVCSSSVLSVGDRCFDVDLRVIDAAFETVL